MGEPLKLLYSALDRALTLAGQQLGNVQLIDWNAGELKIAAQRGFAQDFLDSFRAVPFSELFLHTENAPQVEIGSKDQVTRPANGGYTKAILRHLPLSALVASRADAKAVMRLYPNSHIPMKSIGSSLSK